MPIDDILLRTLPEEEKTAAQLMEKNRLRAAPMVKSKGPDPNNTSWDTEYKRQTAKMLGLDQKYDADGNPRKKSLGEKILAGLNITGAVLGGGNEKRATDRTKLSLETGEKTRIAEINAEQRRDVAKLKAETEREKNEVERTWRAEAARIQNDLAQGRITRDEASAAKTRADALRIAGISQGTSEEGKSIIAGRTAKAGLDTSRAKNLETPEERFNKLSMQGKIAAMKLEAAPYLRNPGSTSQSLANDNGSQVITTRTPNQNPGALPAVQDIIKKYLPPGAQPQPQATVPNPEQGVNRGSGRQEEQKSLPLFPDVAQAFAQQPPPPTAQALADQGLAKNRGEDLKFEIMDSGINGRGNFQDKKYQETRRGINRMMGNAVDLTNQTAGAFVSGTLDKMSGFNGVPAYADFRKFMGEMPVDEAVQNRMRTKQVSGSEMSDFGPRVLIMALKMENKGLSQPQYSSATKVANVVGDLYTRTLQVWKDHGTKRQEEVARDILTSPESPERINNIEKSAAAYINYLGELKNSGAAKVPAPSPNMYLLSRSDEELTKMFPKILTTSNPKAAIERIRATGKFPTAKEMQPATANDNAGYFGRK